MTRTQFSRTVDNDPRKTPSIEADDKAAPCTSARRKERPSCHRGKDRGGRELASIHPANHAKCSPPAVVPEDAPDSDAVGRVRCGNCATVRVGKATPSEYAVPGGYARVLATDIRKCRDCWVARVLINGA